MPRGIPLTPVQSQWGSAEDDRLHVVLVAPEIPPNTGSIARLCAATGVHLHLVEPLGFELDDRHLRRAGLDYWPSVDLTVHAEFAAIEAIFPRSRMHLFSSHGVAPYADVAYSLGDVLIFGRETKGLPADVMDRFVERVRWIPIRRDAVRSINLANAVSVALYEALRQCGFPHLMPGDSK